MRDHTKLVKAIKPCLEKLIKDLEEDRLHSIGIVYVNKDSEDEKNHYYNPGMIRFAKNQKYNRLLQSGVEELGFVLCTDNVRDRQYLMDRRGRSE